MKTIRYVAGLMTSGLNSGAVVEIFTHGDGELPKILIDPRAVSDNTVALGRWTLVGYDDVARTAQYSAE